MHKIVNNLINIENQLKDTSIRYESKKVKIIAVSKTFSLDQILPLIQYGHIDFGENKVQEAVEKWSETKKKNPSIKLHMIGKLQTNKVKYVVPLFDYIHSLDNIKLAKKISEEQKKYKKRLKIFIQINIGEEDQKSGIAIDELKNFYNICVNDFSLNIVGIMCLPPIKSKNDFYFLKMQELIKNLPVHELSMGMSNDYINAYNSGATFLRIGSKIFGERS
tara:strand:+ start:153 stop:812 length:660 start_codon:yes stop_codon:yes gene_type:complete